MTRNLKLVDECAEVLKRILSIVDDSEEAKILHETMKELRGDINYIKEKLECVGEAIESLQTEVNYGVAVTIGKVDKISKVQSQHNLQSRNTTVLTILASVYVPLAFVTVSEPTSVFE